MTASSVTSGASAAPASSLTRWTHGVAAAAPPPPPPPGAPSPFSSRLQVSATSAGPFLRVADDQELSLEGFVLQPNGDRGEMTVLRDGVPLVTARLADTQVFTLPAPVRFAPASTVQFTVLCRNPEGDPCDAALLLTGTLTPVPLPTPPPVPGPVAPPPGSPGR